MSTTKSKTATTKTTAKTTAKKPATKTTAKSTTTKSTTSAAAVTPAPVVVDAPQPVIAGPMMRKKELIDLVVERSGIKKKDAKPVVESMLAVLGEAIADGRELNLHPMGKLKVRRVKQMPNGRVSTAKIRQPNKVETVETSVGLKSVPDAAE